MPKRPSAQKGRRLLDALKKQIGDEGIAFIESNAVLMDTLLSLVVSRVADFRLVAQEFSSKNRLREVQPLTPVSRKTRTRTRTVSGPVPDFISKKGSTFSRGAIERVFQNVEKKEGRRFTSYVARLLGVNEQSLARYCDRYGIERYRRKRHKKSV